MRDHMNISDVATTTKNLLDRGGKKASLVVVTPVFEDVAACSQLVQELTAHHRNQVFVVAVDDGSVLEPLSAQPLADAGLDGVVLRLSRNVGHQRAIAIGLSYVCKHVKGEPRVVVMDSDGEDRPASIASLLSALARDGVDVAVAERKRRIENLRFRMFYAIYKWVFILLSGRRIRFGNFMAMRMQAARRIASMQESWVHLAACVLASNLHVEPVPLDRGRRYAGRSKMNFVGLALHGFRGLMVFAEDVLVRVGIACTLIAALSVVGVVVAVALKTIGYATPGWFSVALGIMLLVFLQTGTLTLVTLMLTGVMRGGGAAQARYQDYILEILRPEDSIAGASEAGRHG